MLKDLLDEKKLSLYQCSKLSGIPYTTLSEVVRGKTKLSKCSAETVLKLSRMLGMSMEDLLSASDDLRPDYEVYKSNVCHRVKDLGELDFIVQTLRTDEVRHLWQRKWYFEAFYLLAMLDYLSRLNGLPLCNQYDDIRAQSLRQPLYPRDVLLEEKLRPGSQVLRRCRMEAVPEFMRFNIVENCKAVEEIQRA